ncbi:integrase [Tanacetum coccineum]|uniref:Integrase n=1 Tax=Tanacetum coccineum TaxID=301880 RepID=A0ABQ5IDJ8_9ASTR
MSFKYNNKVMTLRGTHKAFVHWMEGKQSKKLLESTSVQCCIMSVCMYPPTLLQLRMEEQLENNSTLSFLISLLQDFKDVFAIPTGLPLNRSHDHRIPLKEGTQLVNIRPYRHPPTQKDAIEIMVKELLDVGVIRHSRNASSIRIGVVLQQGGHPIAYMSKALAPKHHSLSTYEKEFLAVIQALEKWKGYLLDRHFIIKTDYFSLKYLMDQRFTTPAQRKWLPNTVSSKLYERIKEWWTKDNELQALGKLVIGKDSDLRKALLRHFHSEGQGGHLGIQTTLKRLAAYAYWKKMRKEVKLFVRNCTIALVEYWYNTSYYTAINNTPFQVVNRQPPPAHITYSHGESPLETVDRSLTAREAVIDLLKFHLKRDQNRMKVVADQRRTTREFVIKDWVVLAKLKAYRGEPPLTPGILPHCNSEGLVVVEPYEIVDRRMAKKGNVAAIYVLVQWTNGIVDDATWELYDDITLRFPEFDLTV